jgi:hypothetical protein
MRTLQIDQVYSKVKAWFLLFVAGSMVFVSGIPSVQAEDPLLIGGFASYRFNFENERAEPLVGDNPLKNRTNIDTELDIEKNWPELSGRFDFNIPATGEEAPGVVRNNGEGIGIEQARFDWTPNFGKDFGLKLTGGVWNMPLGLQPQDAPERLTTSRTLQAQLIPVNFAGFRVSGEAGPLSLGGFKGNEWHDAPEEWSYGFDAGLGFRDWVDLRLGAVYGTEDENDGDGTVYNFVAKSWAVPMTFLGFEYTMDEKNQAFGVTANHTHKEPFRHGLTVRYEQVNADEDSDFAREYFFATPRIGVFPAEAVDISEWTVSGSVEPVNHLEFRLEGIWTNIEEDRSGGVDEDLYTLTLESVYRF